MGDVKAGGLHGFEHGRRRRRCGGHHLHRVAELPPLLGLCVQDDAEHDGRAAEVGHAFIRDGVEYGFCFHLAHADAGARHARQGPGITPAVAVKHGQGPQVHRMAAHVPGKDIADGVEVGAAVVVDDALGLAGGAGGVVERNRLPLVVGQAPVEFRVALAQEVLVLQLAQALAAGTGGVVHVDDQRRFFETRYCLGDDGRKLAVGDQRLGLAVLQAVGDGGGIEADVERIEHRAEHGHGKARLVDGGDVRRHHRDGVPAADSTGRESRGEPAAAGVGFGPAECAVVVDQRRMVGVNSRRAPKEAQR